VKNNFFDRSIGNVYSKPLIKSSLSTQILYGEKFKILKKYEDWIKIITYFDKYTGFIKKGFFKSSFKATHKIFKPKSRIYRKIGSKFKPSNQFLYFSSTIQILDEEKNFTKFEKNKWLKKKDLKKINHIEKNYKKILKYFVNTKYLWGGKSIRGIDCSALIQLFFKYNGNYFPRDTVDQIKFCKKKPHKDFNDGDIIFWKGHVGLCLNRNKFIHAYGPRKKVLIMPTKKTIKLIYKTANLKVKKISNIKKY
tara:strand:- start:493 stop:1245 length:753 start_codon:yes stop_codon:yes gene_type:complete